MKNQVALQDIQGFRWIPNGQSNFDGPALELFRALDGAFLKLAAECGARDFQFPTFIQAQELQKLDYFKSFPHLITFPATLADADENLNKFIDGERCDTKGEVHLTQTSPICDCLTPAACYHFYIHHQGQNLSESKFLTTRAQCYRREKYYAPLQRQWCFNMREVVALGEYQAVKSFLAEYRTRAQALWSRLGLNVGWEFATDPFFDPTNNPKYVLQQIDPVKEEMILDGTLSIGSVNFHKNYFGDSFKITHKGESAFSGCVAFGLERWMYAIVSKYGTDHNQWPWEILRA